MTLPISAYGLLADCNSAALAGTDGSIDWLCLPRYDSRSVFARILDADAGHWSIRPAGHFESSRRYVPGTLVIETTFIGAGGTARLTDAMLFAQGQRGHALGLDAPHELVRLVEGFAGRMEFELALAPRPEYGLARPLFTLRDGGALSVGGPDRFAVSADLPLEVRDSTARALRDRGRGTPRLRLPLGARRAPRAAGDTLRRGCGTDRRHRCRLAVMGG